MGYGFKVRTATTALAVQCRSRMSGARSHEELIVWQLSYQLKLGVYELIRTSTIRNDRNLHDQLRNAARAAHD